MGAAAARDLPVEPTPSSRQAPIEADGCALRVVAMDFQSKVEAAILVDDARRSMEAGKFVWIDVDVRDATRARGVISSLELVADEVLDDALTSEPATQLARYDEYIHLVVTGCRLRDLHFELERVDAIIGERFLMTLHKGPIVFLDAVQKSWRADFQRFAKSPSFLVYELWDHLVDNYLTVQSKFEQRVEKLQGQLIGDVDDRVFGAVSEIGADLLHFRKIVMPARAVLTDLSSRKSLFISEATQPFLANMVGTLERVLQDLMADRDILSESLNLYMSMVSHRTNRVMNRLTVVSVIFLPLTFLCGVYGMNFEVLPELKWRYGYLFFWIAVGLIVGVIGVVMRRKRLL
jgi:magnesium transporter